MASFKNSLSRRIALLALIAAPSLAVGGEAVAQAYPSKAITILVGSAAGGALDAYTRKAGDALAKLVGQPVIIINRPGAAGDIALSQGAKAPPDGYTILVVGKYLSANKYLYKSDYDPIADFVPISQSTTYPMVLVVNPKYPAKTLSEFLATARANPGKINFGNAGVPGKMSMVLLEGLAGVKFTDVPYKSDPDLYTDFLGGRVDAMMTASMTAVPRLKSDGSKALGVTSAEEFPPLPGVPPMGKVINGYSDSFWIGFIAPKGTPQPIVQYLYEKFTEAGKDPDLAKFIVASGMQPAATTPAAFAEFIKKDLVVNEKIIRENKMAAP